MAEELDIAVSEIDTNRFGVKTAKAMLNGESIIVDLMQWCSKQNVDFLIVRCETKNISKVQELEANGFILCDTLVVYENTSLSVSKTNLFSGYSIRVATVDDAVVVEQVASLAFKNFFGHYHTDRNLSSADVDQVYASWARNSCLDKKVAEEVFLVCKKDICVGFLTLKKTDADSAEIVLNAVLPEHQGLGLYASLISHAKIWCISNHISNLSVSTQINNLAPQKVWVRHGFEPSMSFYTFHKWFNK